tara:strand:- start:345 stop:950 length:606 start_codon:yes stop_codon:yes gene_type:complete
MERKKKLRILQFSLLLIGIIIIYFTYYNREPGVNEKTILKTSKEDTLNKSSKKSAEEGDVFFNIEYSGLDLNSNRYLLKSEEAQLDKIKPEIVYMKVVHAIFYFKDDTILYVWADKGIYNNKSLDMKFEKNVKAKYLNSDLFAEKAEYSNSKSYLSIHDNVKINDLKGNLIADKLFFDITKQKLKITSFNNGKINANVNLN